MVVVVTLCIVIIAVSVTYYRKSKRPQNRQISRITSASTTNELHNTFPQASAPAPAPQEKAGEPPPSYAMAQQQYPNYPYPGVQYEMQPTYPQYPAEYPQYPSPDAATYPGHAAYPLQYYPATADDTNKYYPQQEM